MFRRLGCASNRAHRNATVLEAGLFDQRTGSLVERHFKQALYPIQQTLCLIPVFKICTSGGVGPDLEQHKKVRSLDFLIGGEADRPFLAAAESRQQLQERPPRSWFAGRNST